MSISVSAIEASVRDVLMTAVSNSILGRNTNLEMASEMVISSFPPWMAADKKGRGHIQFEGVGVSMETHLRLYVMQKLEGSKIEWIEDPLPSIRREKRKKRSLLYQCIF